VARRLTNLLTAPTRPPMKLLRAPIDQRAYEWIAPVLVVTYSESDDDYDVSPAASISDQRSKHVRNKLGDRPSDHPL
jgi:hypothetical protein